MTVSSTARRCVIPRSTSDTSTLVLHNVPSPKLGQGGRGFSRGDQGYMSPAPLLDAVGVGALLYWQLHAAHLSVSVRAEVRFVEQGADSRRSSARVAASR